MPSRASSRKSSWLRNTGNPATPALCIDIGGGGLSIKTLVHPSLGGSMAAGDIRVRQRKRGHRPNLPGYGGASGYNAAVVTAYLNGRDRRPMMMPGSVEAGLVCSHQTNKRVPAVVGIRINNNVPEKTKPEKTKTRPSSVVWPRQVFRSSPRNPGARPQQCLRPAAYVQYNAKHHNQPGSYQKYRRKGRRRSLRTYKGNISFDG